MAMSTMIKSLEDIMRKDAGLNGDAQYIEQITWLLFLKAFDAKEMEWEFRPDYKGVIPQGYRWRDWAADKEGITGDALIKFIDELFDKLKKLDTSDGDMRKFVVRNVFEDINNYMKSGVYLRQLVNRINEKVDFIDATQKHTFNELYEGMLKDLQSAGRAGEFYTPRPVTNFIVEKVDPKLGETILDPACGTGGFLTSTIAHIGSANTVEEFETLQTSINGSMSMTATPEQTSTAPAFRSYLKIWKWGMYLQLSSRICPDSAEIISKSAITPTHSFPITIYAS